MTPYFDAFWIGGPLDGKKARFCVCSENDEVYTVVTGCQKHYYLLVGDKFIHQPGWVAIECK